MTIDDALADAKARGLDALDAQVLLARCVAQARTWLLAHGDVTLEASQSSCFGALVARRAAGEPLAYLTGVREFRGLLLELDDTVLIPRPETELLVDWGLEVLHLPDWPCAPQVIDLGTGSGAVALALKAEFPTADVFASDTSALAIRVARGNASRLGLEVHFLQGDWWSAAMGRTFDLAVGNPPYIACGDPHLAELTHEPKFALTPGPTGLEAIASVIRGAGARLRAGSWLLLEHGFDQAASVRLMLQQSGFAEVQTRRDIAGVERCTGGRAAA